MDNNEQSLTYVNDYIVHLNNSTYTNGRWVHGTNGQQIKFVNYIIQMQSRWYMDHFDVDSTNDSFIMVRTVIFYMVQMDNGSMETMDTWQHRFTETNKK